MNREDVPPNSQKSPRQILDTDPGEGELAKIFRSPKKVGVYLYVQADFELEDLPEELRRRFGVPKYAFDLELTESTSLVQADPTRVITSLRHQGYYLQLPPPVEL